MAITRTYDQDGDADLWREHSLFSGRRTARYLCYSKSAVGDHVLEQVKVIGEKETKIPFTALTRTVDSDAKAWRKKQLVFKLVKRDTIAEAITDVILCSKSKYAPQDYIAAG